MPARIAVVPAAGLGTRFLPATKAVPKELLPIVDRPAIQYTIDEAVGAGIDHIVIVTNEAKPGIEGYFKPSQMVVDKMRAAGRDELAARMERIGRDVQVSFVYQDKPLGLGHAVGCARALVGQATFAVLLPDELLPDANLLSAMSELNQKTGKSVLGLARVAMDQVSAYGCVVPGLDVTAELGASVVQLAGVVEKPKREEAPSDIVLIGRYILEPSIWDDIAALKPSANGELQLTDALQEQIHREGMHGIVVDSDHYDTGNPFGWLTTVIDIALKDPIVGKQLSEWLRSRGSG